MVITEGSKFSFEINFSIPVNQKFLSIVITDTLANGLSYTQDSASITSTLLPTEVGYTDTSTIYVASATPQELRFTITDLTTVQPSEKNMLTVKIPVEVQDIDALLAAQEAQRTTDPEGKFWNVANVSAYDTATPTESDTPISSLDTPDELDFGACSIYGLGIGYTVTRDAGKDVPLVFALSNIESADTNSLNYQVTITVSEYLDLIFDDPTDPANTSVLASTSMYFHGQPITNIITSATAVVNADGTKTVTLSYPHRGAYSGELLYIHLNTTTNEALEDAAPPVTSFHCPLDADLINTNTSTTNCSAPTFDILVTVTDGDPSIDDGLKSIVLS